ncbi:tRNA uridine-5-carboxymethylaminomethyl(34) synthesis GTPase MnmE [Flavobacteriaceae bacterium]|nr:tRNA uridine-5-carboxymethylaminomethyl(34) synthesis GTPase MnmE [Flavobacteriaceae bacterium]
MMNEGTIIANSSAAGTAAISLLRLSGENAIDLVTSSFKSKSGKKLSDQKSHTIHLGRIHKDGTEIDEVLVSIFKAPNSYTGENVVEISCHGSTYIQQEILQLFIRKGAKPAQPGEFTLRAFLNKKMDLSQAEAVADLIASESKAAHEVALNQMRGGYTQELILLRQKLLDFASLITLELDFSEEDVEFADRKELFALLDEIQMKIKSLADSFAYGSVIKKGVPVAIIGKPNAGKSSLLNALLNDNRAIVSSIAGTTRDTIEDTLTIEGIQFRFIDTAGIRETTDEIEAVGVAKAKEKALKAKVLLYLYDRNDTKLNEIIKDINEFRRDDLILIPVESKVDLNISGVNDFDNALTNKLISNKILQPIKISAFDNASIESLKKFLFTQVSQMASNQDVIITNIRHFDALQKVLKAILNIKNGLDQKISGDLLSVDINEALMHLGEITGEITTEDLLGNVFANFCIGK